jgi:hypothetical protein
MLDDVAAVETAGRPTTRSPDTKAAINYLEASGATAITITEVDGVCAFRIGSKMLARSVAIYWIMQVDAKRVVDRARKIAGNGAGGNAAISALHQAANDTRATLTPHDVAMARAGSATAKLDRYLDSLQGSGALKEFTRMYKRRRIEAKAAGLGFTTSLSKAIYSSGTCSAYRSALDSPHDNRQKISESLTATLSVGNLRIQVMLSNGQRALD